MLTEIEIWLDQKPIDIVSVFVARSVLRELPAVMRFQESKENERDEYLSHVDKEGLDETTEWLLLNRPIIPLHEKILLSFIQGALPLCAGAWPDRLKELPFDKFLESSSYWGACAISVAAVPIEYEADKRAGRAAAASYGARAIGLEAGVVGSLHRYQQIMQKPPYSELRDIASSEDAIFVEEAGSAIELAKQPLWTDFDDFPNHWFGQYWMKLKSHLLTLDQDWDVWTSWYESILNGTWYSSKSEQIELGLNPSSGQYGRLTMPDNYYDNPIQANREIKKAIQFEDMEK